MWAGLEELIGLVDELMYVAALFSLDPNASEAVSYLVSQGVPRLALF